MKILTAEAMREVDRRAIEELGVPSLVLMENAAIGLVDAICREYPDAGSAAIFCGPGNNGGDGLALGRHLAIRGFHVEAILMTGGRDLGGDAAVQQRIYEAMELPLRVIGAHEDLRGIAAAAGALDLVVDALFGVGLTRPLGGRFAELVLALNQLPVPRVAVDLPSGLDGSRFEIPGPCFEAALTVTFGAVKVAHVLAPAAEVVGRVIVAGLGVPGRLVDEAGGGLHLLVGGELADEVRPRAAAGHKGDYGHAVLLAGSEGKSGAAILAARAAVRSGAGLVTVATPADIVQTVDLGSVESMTLSVAQAPDSGLDAGGAERVLQFCRDKDVLAVGPGLGLTGSTVEFVNRVVIECPVPVVVDADGLNALSESAGGAGPAGLGERVGETVLTPHPGELARLLGVTIGEVQADRLAAVGRAAEATGAVVVLKGHQSLVASPDGRIWVNPTGNPGMASGGTGDVLTGMVAGFMAQGYGGLLAACLGVYLHGAAGDLAAESVGETALRAGDLLEAIPEAFDGLLGT